jgi:biopolymer transport protein ExbB
MNRTNALLISCLAVALLLWPPALYAQETKAKSKEAQDIPEELEEALGNVPETAGDDEAGKEAKDADEKPKGKDGSDDEQLNLLTLLVGGGWPMIPIVFMLVLVITFVIERILGLRRQKVLPEDLTREFGRLAAGGGGFDPRKAYQVCQRYPCAAANIIRAMLLKIGRPHAEVEHAVMEANEREAAQLYANVRWLNLAAAVTPLMGLFGTVWGMINAFYATANLPEGASKAQVLADGIVIALVTTLGGLFVAIPAAICAHFFEGRIQTLFREMDELLFSLLPQIERFEGKLRVSREQLDTASSRRKGGAEAATTTETSGEPAAKTGGTSQGKSEKVPVASQQTAKA